MLKSDTVKAVLCVILGVLFVAAGVLHFTSPASYLAIMPPYLPAHLALVYISGCFEMLGGIGIIVPQTRRWAGYGLAALLVAVFPANLHMALNGISLPGLPASPLLLWLRLPLQFVLILLVLWATGVRQRQREVRG